MVKLESLNKGVSLVEVIIATTIVLGMVLALLGVHTLYIKIGLSTGNTVKATYLAEEGLEALRFLRDDSWVDNIEPLLVDTPYGVALSGNSWEVDSALTWVGYFERTVTLSDVYRDVNGDIVTSGGTLDPDARLVTATVAWPTGAATTTKTISTYLTNLRNNN